MKTTQSIQLLDAKSTLLRLDRYDYIYLMWHDDVGVLSIVSSYGDYSYIWNSRGRDTTLRKFFIEADKHYLSDKLWPSEKRKYDFDEKKAIQELKKLVLKDRKEDSLSKHVARYIYDELVGLSNKFEYNDKSIFMYEMSQLKHFREWYCDWYEIRYGEEPRQCFLTLRDEIIPLIQEYFKESLKESVTL